MQPHLPEFHTALITISAALIAIAGIVTAVLGTRQTNAPFSRRLIVAMLPFLIISIVLGILAMWRALYWFLTPNITVSFQAVYFLLGQALLITIALGAFTGSLLSKSKTGGKMVNTRDMEELKDQLTAFKEALEKTGLAPNSQIWAGFASFMLLKESKWLRLLTMGLLVLSIILALLIGWDILLRLAR